jgi:transitional endoplasmic reticulum ATPase
VGLTLSPTQQKARKALVAAITRPGLVALAAESGMGRTTILGTLGADTKTVRLDVRDFMAALGRHHPLALEESWHELVTTALARDAQLVLFDDFQSILNVCLGHMYPRTNLLWGAIQSVSRVAHDSGKSVVVSMDKRTCGMISGCVTMGSLTSEDYAHFLGVFLGADRAGRLDVGRIHRFARKLTARALETSCTALREKRDLDTDGFVEYLRVHQLATNVDLGEVEAVALDELKGVDDVIQALEANLVLPFEEPALATELGLKPKRGVLLVGPPGTGKTTIGRALAHRLKSKFFLIDGTVVGGTPNFFATVHRIFEAAKHNAPSIVFIDDSDVLFEDGSDHGFYRYLLTMLDGIESESAGRICLMMTAMDVASLPPALVRSGRVELWLEMRLPDADARQAILAQRCASLPASVGPVDVARLAAASEGLTGADLKRVIEDGMLLLGYDRARHKPQRPAVDYFVQAVESVRANKQRYAAASGRGRMGVRGKNIPPMVFQQMARAMESGGTMINGFFGDAGGDEP